MYVTDQPAFLNGALQIETELQPAQLLQVLKQIESTLGRDQHDVRNGPRPIDLDIITFDEHALQDDANHLSIPHPRLHERQFVLQPICDISPDLRIPGPDGTFRTAQVLLSELLEREDDSGLKRVTPFRRERFLRWGEQTILMGIVNVTPDSFSDGGLCSTVGAALQQVESFRERGFNVIDVRGS